MNDFILKVPQPRRTTFDQPTAMLHLSEYEKIKIRNSCDRYGFSYLLAAQLKLPLAPYSFANWVHGWSWNDAISHEEIIGCNGYHKTLSIIVGNQNERNALECAGYANVVVGGLPFAYVPNQNRKPLSGALLAFLPHSAEVEKANVMQVEYLDYLASCLPDFSEIFVSIYWLDNSDNLQHEIRRRKLKPLLGARPDDKNSLIRTRRMLEYCPYVTSNTMGSHIAYALYVGCSVSVTAPFYEYGREVFLTGGNPHGHSSSYIDKMMEMQSMSFVKKKYPWLFVDHPLQGIRDVEFGKKAVGLEWKLNPSQIKKALGWTLGGQVYGYGTGMTRRLVRIMRGLEQSA